jgi:hypothetical protein
VAAGAEVVGDALRVKDLPTQVIGGGGLAVVVRWLGDGAAVFVIGLAAVVCALFARARGKTLAGRRRRPTNPPPPSPFII